MISTASSFQPSRKQAMKLSGFVMYLSTFLVAWFALAAGGWIYAQDFAAQSVMPWLMQIISQSYTHATSVVGAAIAIVGGLASAIVIAIVVLSLMAAAHRIGKLARSS